VNIVLFVGEEDNVNEKCHFFFVEGEWTIETWNRMEIYLIN